MRKRITEHDPYALVPRGAVWPRQSVPRTAGRLIATVEHLERVAASTKNDWLAKLARAKIDDAAERFDASTRYPQPAKILRLVVQGHEVAA